MAELHLLSPKGFRAAGVYAGIKSKQTPDVGLLVADEPATAAAVFTSNQVFAAPVKVGREHVAAGKLRGVVVNSGNANACTGQRGERDARLMADLAARAVGAAGSEFLPSSTGIIGHPLPMAKVRAGIRAAAAQLGDSAEHAGQFASAIMTTDLKRKTAAASFTVNGERITVAGVCKGSGMIGPRLSLKPIRRPTHATMLAYLTTDARVAAPLLRQLLAEAADLSFNAVTVDDQTSTNDTAVILASGQSGVRLGGSARPLADAITEVCRALAYQIAADGEGATKVVEVHVTAAPSPAAAQTIARSIANSPLVKCAMHGNDPNWGRIVCAAGQTEAPFDPARATLSIQKTLVFRAGGPARFNPTKLSKAMNTARVLVELNCGGGHAQAVCYTCDLSKDYVTINADYHT